MPGSSAIVRAAVDASTAPATLVGVTDDGHVLRSTTTGRARGRTTQPPLAGSFFTARIAAGGGRIAVLFGGADALGVAVSDDGGTTWATWAHPSAWAADALAVAADDTVAVSGDDGVRVASAGSPPASAPVALKLPVTSWRWTPRSARRSTSTPARGWARAPPSLTRQWLRCLPADPSACSPIAGATGRRTSPRGRTSTTTSAPTSRAARRRSAPTPSPSSSRSRSCWRRGALAGALVVGATVTVTPATWAGADTVTRTISSCAPGLADCRTCPATPTC